MATKKITLGEAADRRGLRQADLAKQMGVSISSISRWLAGETHPRELHQVIRLCRLLGVRFDDIRWAPGRGTKSK